MKLHLASISLSIFNHMFKSPFINTVSKVCKLKRVFEIQAAYSEYTESQTLLLKYSSKGFFRSSPALNLKKQGFLLEKGKKNLLAILLEQCSLSEYMTIQLQADLTLSA